MRLLSILLLTFVCLENCSCFSPYSVKPPLPVTPNYGAYLTVKPRNWDKKPNRTRILRTAADVLETLGNTTLQSFATTFLSMKQKKLLSALKGVSIAARLLSSESHPNLNRTLDNDTKIMVNSIKENVKKLSEKVYSNTNYYLDSIYKTTEEDIREKIIEELKGKRNDSEFEKFKRSEFFFNSEIVVPINRTTKSMIAYLSLNDYDNMNQFTNDYLEHNMEQVVSNCLQLTPALIGGKMNVSGFSNDIFEELRSNLTRYLFHAFIIQYFEIGVGSVRYPYSGEMKVQDAVFKIRHSQFSRILKKEALNYRKSYFPGTIAKDILAPTIEDFIFTYGRNGSNCLMAESIMKQLDEKFPWRKYAVIVAETYSKINPYASVGFPKRMLAYHYMGKSALVFMATKNATENKQFHYDHKEAIFMADQRFDGDNLNATLKYVENGDKYYQMAAFAAETDPCVSPLNSPFSDAFSIGYNGKQAGIVVVF